MPTEKEVADIYQRALDALSETIAARTGVTEQQKDLAEQKQKQLSLEFVNTAIKNVEERTAKFQEFIGVMQALIDEFDPSITVEGIKELKGLVHDAGQLISAALPKAEVALPATAEKQTAGAQPKPTMAAVEPKPLAKAPTSVAKPATGAKAKAKQPATPSTAKASKAGTPAAKAPPSATTKPGSKAKSAPAPKKPVKKKPSVAKPAAKKPAAKKPTTKKPVTKKPATKKPAAKRAPAQKKPVRKGKKPS